MTTDSTTKGFIVPISEPINDEALTDAIHTTLHGVIGTLLPEMIRPRWQPNPVNSPEGSQDWVAFGIQGHTPDVFAAETHHESINGGEARVEREEVMACQIAFYGPNAYLHDARLRAGLDLAQNRWALNEIGVAFVEYQAPVRVPDLRGLTWINKIEATLVLRRRTRHVYPVRSLQEVSRESSLENEHYSTPLIAQPPAST